MICTTTKIDLESSLAFLLDAPVRGVMFYFETSVCNMHLKHSVTVCMFTLDPGCLTSYLWSYGMLTRIYFTEMFGGIGVAPISVNYAIHFFHE